MSKQKHKGPEFIDKLEEQIYGLLTDAFKREECAARAAARLEYDLVTQYQQNKATPATDVEDVAEPVSNDSRDFETGQFQALFSNLNNLRTMTDLAKMLELEPERISDIANTMIVGMFGKPQQSKAVGVRSSNAVERKLIGTDDEVMLERLREAAAVRQRSG